jgi:GntR family transcriptional regulator
VAMWQDIADALREAVTRGDYPPGTTIPKETELMAAHGAGRETVRRAIIQLTAEGLVEPVRRRGTVVRARPARQLITRSRLVYRDELGYYFDLAAQGWRPLRPPVVSRGPVPFDIAVRLGLAPGDEAVIRDRIMGQPETGRPTQLATSYIPAALAAELPVLAARDTGPGGIYDRMEEAGFGPIRWTEGITTRPPSPVEASRLGLAPGVALLRIVRLGSSPDGRPLEVNDTRMSGEEFEISYPLSRDASPLQQLELRAGRRLPGSFPVIDPAETSGTSGSCPRRRAGQLAGASGCSRTGSVRCQGAGGDVCWLPWRFGLRGMGVGPVRTACPWGGRKGGGIRENRETPGCGGFRVPWSLQASVPGGIGAVGAAGAVHLPHHGCGGDCGACRFLGQRCGAGHGDCTLPRSCERWDVSFAGRSGGSGGNLGTGPWGAGGSPQSPRGD